MNRLDQLFPTERKRKWFSVLSTAVLGWLFTLLTIYGFSEYGIALFFLLPLFMGFMSTVLYGYKRETTSKEARYVSFLTLTTYTAGLVLFAIEGLICILMAAPIGLFLSWIGSFIGHAAVSRLPNKAPTTLLVLFTTMLTTAFGERDSKPSLSSVVTSIEIDATPEVVWQNLIQFPQLKEPTEFLFKSGIAYPINARIEGRSVGAVRHCNFTTGSFIEPITVWDEPRLLRFSVEKQPAPLKEVSIWDIDAPHLHDYFVSKQGQFKLTPLPNGKTLLEGTTWYYHNIRPEWYWRPWSNYIIYKIHDRVLNHIKVNAETKN